jgi:uncharacterized membrane protein YfcA
MHNLERDPGLLLALGLSAFISEALYGATCFGPAITFNVGWQVCHMLGLSDGTLSTAAVELTIYETTSAALQALFLRRHICPHFVAVISIPLCGFTVLGQILMLRLDETASGSASLKRVLGGVLLLLAAQRGGALWVQWKRRRRTLDDDDAVTGRNLPAPAADSPNPPPMRHFWTARIQFCTFVWFSAAGIMGGLTSVGGPPIMVWVSLFAHLLHFDSWRASNAATRLLLNLARGAVLACQGRVRLDRSYPSAITMILSGWLGLLAGNRLAPLFKNTDMLQAATLLFLVCGAVLMEAAGFPESIQQPVSLGVGGVAVLCASIAALASLPCLRRGRAGFGHRGVSAHSNREGLSTATRSDALLANASVQ